MEKNDNLIIALKFVTKSVWPCGPKKQLFEQWKKMSDWKRKTCLLSFEYIYQQEINYDSPRGGVSVITEKGEVTTSYLLIQKAKIADSGKYTCMPTHANPNAVNVHVLNGRLEYLYEFYWINFLHVVCWMFERNLCVCMINGTGRFVDNKNNNHFVLLVNNKRNQNNEKKS